LPEISISIFCPETRDSETQLPNAPFYRRWSVLLAGVIGVAAITAVLGWRGFQEASPPTTTTAPSTTVVAPTTTEPPTSVGPTSKPDAVLWSAEGSDVRRSEGFRAPARWRIEWEFDCTNFKEFGVGSFKITGGEAFERVDIQANNLQGRGRKSFTQSGYGHLLVESVCQRWKVTVLSG
jgi:hypothetical protein